MALTDDLFQSIDTIVSARIAKLPYDQTIECEVVNADKAEDNIYTVRYQVATFEAISPSIQYSVGDRVYVAIPQNDYTQNKIILNKKQEDEIITTKTLPFLSFAYNSLNNLFSQTQQNKEFNISTKSDKKEELIQIPINLLTQPIIGYTRLGFKCSISSNIPQQMKSGDYGIKIEAHGFKQDNTMYPYSFALNAENMEHTFEFYLKTSDMISANYYNTLGYCNQEKIFDITNYVIDSIKVYLWQDGNFRTIEDIAVINKMINFTNFQLYIGYDITEFKKEKSKIILYSTDGLLYNSEYTTKHIEVRYIQYDKNELIESNINTNNYYFYWEQYDNSKTDISTHSNLLSFKDIENSNPIILNINLLSSRAFKNQQFVYTLENKATNEKIISNILSFTNFAYIANSEVLDILTGLSVEPIVEDGYNGIYYIYGQDNYTTDQIITSKTHYLSLSYVPVASLDSTIGFKPGDIISWTFPSDYTMLIPVLGMGQYNKVQNPLTNEYIKDKITLTLQSGDIDINGRFNIPYLIKDYYSPQNTNNIIEIEMIRGAETYTTQFELSFGTSGSQGAEYIIVPYLLYQNEKIKAVVQSYGINIEYILDFDIYDYNNNKIELTSNITANYETLGSIGFNINGNKIKIISSTDNLSDYYGLIKISVNIYGKNIIAYFPIPITKNKDYISINGSTIITYDITGKKPFYNKNKLLINKNGTTLTDIDWRIGYYDKNNIFQTGTGELQAWPKIINGELNLPSILHNQLFSCKMILMGYENNALVWSQPLVIIQNKYPMGLEHNESNQVEIENNIFIKNAMVGEVKQNLNNGIWDNKLSGVFIGILDNQNNNNDEFGLFGYHQGDRFFQLSEDGYVFLNGGNNDNSETAGVIIDNALIRTSTLEDIDFIGNLNFKTNNFKINNLNNTQIFSLDQNGNLTINGNLNATSFVGTVTTAEFATRAVGDSSSEMTIHNKFEKIKTALNILASKHIGTTLDLW